jgi:internalin A
LVGLEKLGIHLARRLADVDEVASCALTLSEFRLEYCSQIMNLDSIAPLTRLTALEVADCRSIDSLRPLSSLAALERFLAWGSTRIMDADLSPLLTLPRLTELRMKSRREYEPSVKEVQSELVPPMA